MGSRFYFTLNIWGVAPFTLVTTLGVQFTSNSKRQVSTPDLKLGLSSKVNGLYLDNLLLFGVLYYLE
jgi:hypothetical protein